MKRELDLLAWLLDLWVKSLAVIDKIFKSLIKKPR